MRRNTTIAIRDPDAGHRGRGIPATRGARQVTGLFDELDIGARQLQTGSSSVPTSPATWIRGPSWVSPGSTASDWHGTWPNGPRVARHGDRGSGRGPPEHRVPDDPQRERRGTRTASPGSRRWRTRCRATVLSRMVQLSHNGGVVPGGWSKRPALAPSPIAQYQEPPKALDHAEIDELVGGVRRFGRQLPRRRASTASRSMPRTVTSSTSS